MDFQGLRGKYNADGFLRIDPFYSSARMEEIERELQRYLTEMLPSLPPGDVVYEEVSTAQQKPQIRNLWRLEKHSPFFNELAQERRLLDLVGTLVNGKPVLIAVELFAKPAGVGSAVPYHQDNGYFNLTPPDALTCWVALDDSSVENGCVYYARGSHRLGLLPHKASLVPGNSWGLARVPEPNELDEVAGVLSRGGSILHHCCTLHRSEKNLSDRPRRGLLMVYKGDHCQVDLVGMEKYEAALRALREHMSKKT